MIHDYIKKGSDGYPNDFIIDNEDEYKFIEDGKFLTVKNALIKGLSDGNDKPCHYTFAESEDPVSSKPLIENTMQKRLYNRSGNVTNDEHYAIDYSGSTCVATQKNLYKSLGQSSTNASICSYDKSDPNKNNDNDDNKWCITSPTPDSLPPAG